MSKYPSLGKFPIEPSQTCPMFQHQPTSAPWTCLLRGELPIHLRMVKIPVRAEHVQKGELGVRRREKGGWGREGRREEEGNKRSPRVSSGPGLLPAYTLTLPTAKTVSGSSDCNSKVIIPSRFIQIKNFE